HNNNNKKNNASPLPVCPFERSASHKPSPTSTSQHTAPDVPLPKRLCSTLTSEFPCEEPNRMTAPRF
uniref:Uncharacterized protein n=1 Tax=Anopheles quadriannulatus TaxID=34691 RepID=A0A182XRH1_ANOQN